MVAKQLMNPLFTLMPWVHNGPKVFNVKAVFNVKMIIMND